jgi:Flp pilus assembly protein TadD
MTETLSLRRRLMKRGGTGSAPLGALLVVGILAWLGCATTPSLPPEETSSLEARLAARGIDPAAIVDPIAVTPEMGEWIRGKVSQDISPGRQVRRLLEVLVGEPGLDLQYERSHTGTAQEAFASREANCLGFTHLFVGLGRELNLPVYYLGFRQRPRFGREGDLVVVWEHVTAVFDSATERLILQFPVGPDIDYGDAKILPDLTGIAMHYSNLGAESLREGRLEEARESLEISITLDPEWSHGWLNLGVVLRRQGDLDGAERAYRRALEINPDYLQAYNNLATLLRLRGQKSAAAEILRILDRRDNRDPFIYLALGDSSRRSGLVKDARRYYLRAFDLAPDRAEPAVALGLLELRAGKRRAAERWLKRAERIDPQNDRLERLRSALETGPETPPESARFDQESSEIFS